MKTPTDDAPHVARMLNRVRLSCRTIPVRVNLCCGGVEGLTEGWARRMSRRKSRAMIPPARRFPAACSGWQAHGLAATGRPLRGLRGAERFGGIRALAQHDRRRRRRLQASRSARRGTEAAELRQPLWYDAAQNPDLAARLAQLQPVAGAPRRLLVSLRPGAPELPHLPGSSRRRSTSMRILYFSVNGRRQKERSQLCLTNPTSSRSSRKRCSSASRPTRRRSTSASRRTTGGLLHARNAPRSMPRRSRVWLR